jgi:hypothetical protein
MVRRFGDFLEPPFIIFEKCPEIPLQFLRFCILHFPALLRPGGSLNLAIGVEPGIDFIADLYKYFEIIGVRKEKLQFLEHELYHSEDLSLFSSICPILAGQTILLAIRAGLSALTATGINCIGSTIGNPAAMVMRLVLFGGSFRLAGVMENSPSLHFVFDPHAARSPVQVNVQNDRNIPMRLDLPSSKHFYLRTVNSSVLSLTSPSAGAKQDFGSCGWSWRIARKTCGNAEPERTSEP